MSNIRHHTFAYESTFKMKNSNTVRDILKRGAWQAMLVECVTLGHRVVGSSPTMGERILKNKIFKKN